MVFLLPYCSPLYHSGLYLQNTEITNVNFVNYVQMHIYSVVKILPDLHFYALHIKYTSSILPHANKTSKARIQF